MSTIENLKTFGKAARVHAARLGSHTGFHSPVIPSLLEKFSERACFVPFVAFSRGTWSRFEGVILRDKADICLADPFAEADEDTGGETKQSAQNYIHIRI